MGAKRAETRLVGTPEQEAAARVGMDQDGGDEDLDVSNESLDPGADLEELKKRELAKLAAKPAERWSARPMPNAPAAKAPASAAVVKPEDLERLQAEIDAAGPAVFVESDEPEVVAAGGLVNVPVATISESPTNPRKVFGDVEALARSIKELGFVQHLVVRPIGNVPGHFELVVGHRRLRAAKLLGMVEVPCEVREFDDTQALQFQLAENIERESLKPLEEAEGLFRLREDGKLSTAQIAEQVGKSDRWVQSRIQLLRLGPEARTYLNEDAERASICVLLAGIGSHKLQADAVEELGKMAGDDGKVSYRTAKDFLRDNYATELRGVAFDRGDALLVPGAGACSTCPKRSGNNPELFSEMKRADLCLDRTCFQEKLDAHWDLEREKAKGKGYKTVSMQEGRRLFKGGTLPPMSDWIDLGAPCPTDKKKRPWREVLGDKVKDPELVPVTAAPDGTAHVHLLVPRIDALQVAKKSGAKWAESAAEQTEARKPATKEQSERRQHDEQVQEYVEQAVIDRSVSAVEEMFRSCLPAQSTQLSAVLRMVCMGLAQTFRADVLSRRGLKNELELEALIEKTTKPSVLLGLIFEMATCEWVKGHDGYSEQLRAMARVLKLDFAAIENLSANTEAAEQLFKGKKRSA